MNAPAFATSPAADVGAVLIGTHHASAQFAENAKGRLVARQPELPLKLNGG